jgi:uncharacterized membrane protein
MIAGVVVLVPVVVTFLVLRLVFRWMEGLAQPLTRQLFQIQADIPGLGIVLTLIVIWLTGLVASNVFGRRMIGHGDDILMRLPIVGNIYGPVKQFMQNVANSDRTQGFRRVVLAEYPTEGLWILGFATGEMPLDQDGRIGRCVFVPTSPNPATGWMVVFPPEKVRELSLSVEEAMQLIVSGGFVVPDALKSVGVYGTEADTGEELFGLEQQAEPDSQRS